MVVSVYAAFCVVLVVPVVGVAGCDVIGCIVMVADGQVQSICAGTVVGVGVFVGICASFGICTVVPCERFAGILVVNIVSAVVDSEVEGVDVCAGRAWLGVVIGVGSACRVVLSIPVVVVASGYVVRCVIVVCYCEMQGVGTGAVVGVDVVVNVSACFGICAVVPCIVFAGILVVDIVCAVVDSEV